MNKFLDSFKRSIRQRDDPNTSDDTKDLELRPNKRDVTYNFNLSSHNSSIKPKRLRPAPVLADYSLEAGPLNSSYKLSVFIY
ncbi:unnamed protein product [Rhizophagus irregularis]|nr:unnamed protein product [Rhizophagus irregularis]